MDSHMLMDDNGTKENVTVTNKPNLLEILYLLGRKNFVF